MGERRWQPFGPAWAASTVLAGVLCAAPAEAHKLVVFAVANGRTLEGEAYFRGGTPVARAKVTVVGPNDELLGETTTGAEGKFTFEVRSRFDHTLIVDAGEGHTGRYTVPAEELPKDLPAPGGRDRSPGQLQEPTEAAPDAGSGETAASLVPSGGPARGSVDARIAAEIEALRLQITALRTDLDWYRNEMRLRDILGGIGYILGIMGIAFYFLGVRRKEKQAAKTY